MKNTMSLFVAALLLAGALGCRFGGAAESENKNASVKQANSARRQPTAATPRPAAEPATDANDEPDQANEPDEADGTDDEPLRSTALVDAFKRDAAAANVKYKGKTLLIRGRVTNINDVFGVKALNLRDSENVLGLQTYLKNEADVERVKVGDEVTVRGKVRGDRTDVIDDAVLVEVN